MSNDGHQNPMPDPWSTVADWQVVRADNGLVFDALGLNLLGLSPGHNPPNAVSLASAGPRVSLPSGDMPCGQWIESCFHADAHDAALVRCASDNDALLDAAFANGTLSISSSPLIKQSQQLRHDFANRINNIHVNAQLIRLWGRQRDDNPLQDASQRILDECGEALQFAKSALSAIEAEQIPRCEVATTLHSLLFRTEATQPPLTVAVRHSNQMPFNTVVHTAHFLNSLAQQTSRALDCSMEPLNAGNGDDDCTATLELTIVDPLIESAGAELVQRQWHNRANEPLAMPNMDQNSTRYVLTCRADTLRLTIN